MTMDRQNRIAWLFVGTVLLGLLTISGIGTVAAANNSSNVSDVAPYYTANDSQVMNETWLENNTEPTAENTTSLFVRLSTFVIGSGVRGNQVWAGTLTMGIVFGGAVIGAVAGVAGVVGGAVIGFAMLSGMVTLGMAPAWVWPVALFALGLILTGVYIRLQ